MRENFTRSDDGACEFPKEIAKNGDGTVIAKEKAERLDSVDGLGPVRGLFATKNKLRYQNSL
jgi:hypothetical protein